jgi:hypothetical protein
MVTPNDIERLAIRLRELLGEELSPEEKALLDSILDVAWEALQLTARDRFIRVRLFWSDVRRRVE